MNMGRFFSAISLRQYRTDTIYRILSTRNTPFPLYPNGFSVRQKKKKRPQTRGCLRQSENQSAERLGKSVLLG